jgi:formamidase
MIQKTTTYVGSTMELSLELLGTIAKEGARTIPRRENASNCDIKNLSHGSRVYFTVYVKGTKFSIGDLHFSQGD